MRLAHFGCCDISFLRRGCACLQTKMLLRVSSAQLQLVKKHIKYKQTRENHSQIYSSRCFARGTRKPQRFHTLIPLGVCVYFGWYCSVVLYKLFPTGEKAVEVSRVFWLHNKIPVQEPDLPIVHLVLRHLLSLAQGMTFLGAVRMGSNLGILEAHAFLGGTW